MSHIRLSADPLNPLGTPHSQPMPYFRPSVTDIMKQTIRRKDRLTSPPIALAALAFLTLGACTSTTRVVVSDHYWQTLDTRELEPKEVITHWPNMHAERVAPLTDADWASAESTKGNIKVNFTERCAGLVELPSEQRLDVKHVGGWHEELGLMSLSAAALALTVGVGAILMKDSGWDDELAAGHPAIESYNSNQDIDIAMISSLSAGGAFAILSGTSYLLDKVVTTEVTDTSSLYGLTGSSCDPDDEDTFALVPTLTGAELAGVGELKLGVRSILVPSEGDTVSAENIQALFSGPSTLNLSVNVAADVPGAGDQYPVAQTITLKPDAHASVVDTIAQGLAKRGVALNTGGEARVTVTKEGYALTLDAHAALTPPLGMEANELATRMGDAIVEQGDLIVASKAVAQHSYLLSEAEGAELEGKAHKGAFQFRHVIPLQSTTMSRVIADWRDAESAPDFNARAGHAQHVDKKDSSAGSLAWKLSDADREKAHLAALKHSSALIQKSSFTSLNLKAKSFDAEARMVASLPSASTYKERLCASPPAYLSEACTSFNNAWSVREKALTAATSKQLKQAVKSEMKALTKYIAGQKRAASKGEGLDINSGTDPAGFAQEQCGSLSTLESTLCDKSSTLFDSGTCGMIKGCERKLAGPVKGIVAKLKAAEKREAQAYECARKKCPDVGYCSMNTQFDAFGRIRAYPRRCSYMIESCRKRDPMAAMNCMQNRYNSCRRGCGLRD